MKERDAHWHAIHCKGGDGCRASLVVSVTGLSDGETEAALNRVGAWAHWYPITSWDWLCAQCGKERLHRRDQRAETARKLAIEFRSIMYSARAA